MNLTTSHPTTTQVDVAEIGALLEQLAAATYGVVAAVHAAGDATEAVIQLAERVSVIGDALVAIGQQVRYLTYRHDGMVSAIGAQFDALDLDIAELNDRTAALKRGPG